MYARKCVYTVEHDLKMNSFEGEEDAGYCYAGSGLKVLCVPK